MDLGADDSYCPKNMTIQCGDHPTMMFDYASVKFDRPLGWIELDLLNDDTPLDAFAIRLVVTGNHQNGKDSRIRGVRVFGRNPGPGS